jgi:hypothetical protein
MHPLIQQQLAADRVNDMIATAATARLGHSRGVAELAAQAGPMLGLSPAPQAASPTSRSPVSRAQAGICPLSCPSSPFHIPSK